MFRVLEKLSSDNKNIHEERQFKYETLKWYFFQHWSKYTFTVFEYLNTQFLFLFSFGLKNSSFSKVEILCYLKKCTNLKGSI